jgi:hypothetical protein
LTPNPFDQFLRPADAVTPAEAAIVFTHLAAAKSELYVFANIDLFVIPAEAGISRATEESRSRC